MIINIILYSGLLGLCSLIYYFEPEILKNQQVIILIITFGLFIASFFIMERLSSKKIIDFIEKEINKIINKKICNENNLEYIKSETFKNNNEINLKNEGKTIWKTITNLFSEYQKTEVYNKAKQNNITDNFSFHLKDQEYKLSKIFLLSHYLEIIYAFKDAIFNIYEEKENDFKETKEIKLLQELDYSLNLLKYKIGIFISTQYIVKIIFYLLFIVIIIFIIYVISAHSWDFFLKKYSYLYKDILYFFLGLSLIIISFPFTYFAYNYFKIWRLKLFSKQQKHDEWQILFKDLFIYIIFFILFILIFIFGFYFLTASGEPYFNFFELFKNLLFPVVQLEYLNQLKNFLYLKSFNNELGNNEFIALFIILKIAFIFFTTFLGVISIKHFTEKYLEFYDNHKDKRHMVPPEFIKIFSYLVLFIIFIILLYGTLFINYPDLIDNINNSTHIDNNLTNSLTIDNKNKSSIKDYLPLSIFLAIFGAIATIATKDILENYFAGLSLKINSPYEEGERVSIDNEMMEVRSIGFRADKFYGINTNTEITIPHKKLIQSTIVNYTKPTLDYRRKITIFVPDQRIDKNIPRKAEMVLLLATFISTGVKKPKIKLNKENFKKLEDIINKYKEKIKSFKNNETANLKNCENEAKVKKIIEEIWEFFKESDKKFRKNLFLDKIQEIIDENDNNNEELKNTYFIIKKIISAIIATVYDFEQESKKFKYHIDEYCIKRKFKTFQIDNSNNEEKKEIDFFKNISKLLVNINYYYFALASQIWHIKNMLDTNLKKIYMDNISLTLLDVPRVTSAHKKYEKDIYWEITLLVTVELGEQSDEIIHHINMHIDDLWELFDLPTYYFKENNPNTHKGNKRKRSKIHLK